tara:strand:- start:8024 stop:9439 length:1416 start_codon:yes stop_codon:yes gene_type:complete
MYLDCLTGQVPQQCNNGVDCAFLGCVDGKHCGVNAGFGLGAMGKSGKAPSILAEYSMISTDATGADSNDFYDMSQVDGFSLVDMAFGPIPHRTQCALHKETSDPYNARPITCLNHCQDQCPPELQDNRGGSYNGCISICQAVLDNEHRDAYRKSNQKCKNLATEEDTVLDIMAKQTVYWDKDYDASSERIAPNDDIWNGDWGEQKDFKTKGKWRVDTDGSICGFRDITNWSAAGMKSQYEALATKNNGECKFLIDMLCCATNGGCDKGNNTCINPTDNDAIARIDGTDGNDPNCNQFGCSPWNVSYYNNKDNTSVIDYYKKTSCWDSDWPKPYAEWCKHANIPKEYCNYAHIFKMGCPNAYSWQFDDGNSTYQARLGDYYLEFCPDTVGGNDPKGNMPDYSNDNYCVARSDVGPVTPAEYCKKRGGGQLCKSGDICCDANSDGLCPGPPGEPGVPCCKYDPNPVSSKCFSN